MRDVGVSLPNWRNAALAGSIAILACLGAGAQEPPRASEPWLGVYLIDEVDGGIRIVAVVPGGPASVAGLRSGDLLIEAGDVQLADQAALERVLAGRLPEQELRVAVLRDGQQRTFRLRTSVRSPTNRFPTPPVLPRAPRARLGLSAGLKTVPITEELRAHYGAPKDRGVLVVRVDAAGACGVAGIEVGDVLVGIGSDTVTAPAEVQRALARRDRSVPIAVRLIRKREPLTKDIAPQTPRMPSPPPRVLPASEARRRYLELSIETMERQLEALREQLAELKRDPEPANPDR